MAFNAEVFRGNLANQRPASPNIFKVTISMPPIFNSAFAAKVGAKAGKDWSQVFRDTTFRCEIAQLPGRQIATQKRDHAGPTRDVPIGLTYNTIQLSFIEGKAFRMRELFDAWQEIIFTERSGRMYEVPYYNDIVSPSITIEAYSQDGNLQKTYVLFNAYPVSVAPQQLGWANNNQYLSVPVEFSFQFWQTFNQDAIGNQTQPTRYIQTGATKDVVAGANIPAPPTKPGLQSIVQKDKLSLLEKANQAITKVGKVELTGISFIDQNIQSVQNVASAVGKFTDAQTLVNQAKTFGLEQLTGVVNSPAAQSIISKAGTLLQENLPAGARDLVAAAATGQDVRARAKSLALEQGVSILGSVQAEAQSVVLQGVNTVLENLPFADLSKQILQPAAQAVVDKQLNKQKQTALKKLAGFL